MYFNAFNPNAGINKSQRTNDIVILHDHLARRREDRYIVNFAQCLESSGFKVTLITSDIESNNCLDNVKLCDNIKVEKRLNWIPRHFFGLLHSTLSTYRALCLALSVIVHPPSNNPCVILMDTELIGLFALKMLSSHKVFYIEQFRSLRHNELCCNLESKLFPNLFEARWIKYADQIIVESPVFVEIFKKSFPSTAEPKVMIPLIDYGLWIEPGININRIVPDLDSKSCTIFVALGKYRRSSNFKLVLDAFEELLSNEENQLNKSHLIIAGNCKLSDEKRFYQSFVDRLKRRSFAAQVTVLRQIPKIHTKTLLIEASVVLHASRNDICSDYLLEAMSLGKPIVAVNKGIASMVLENRITGVLVEPKPKLFAAAMAKVALSPHIRNFLGEMAKDAFSHRYSFESFSRRMLNLVLQHVTPLERIRVTESKNDWISCTNGEDTGEVY